MDMQSLSSAIVDNWPVWIVTVVLAVAAVIDGKQLKVPNWITFPMIASGWVYSFWFFGWSGLGWSMVGMCVGLALLLPAYCIGGMGAGDVKLMAGVGAWLGSVTTFYAFCLTTIVGAVIAVGMVLYQKRWHHHKDQFFHIVDEVMTVKDPEKLAVIAAERKPTMLLLPYGIPMAIGSIAYFAWAGMLL
jgi:prepilin peptidase CpaA